MRTKHPNTLQRGATVVESSLVCIPLVLIAALVLEFTHSQQVRHIADLALYEAARAGSVSGAHPKVIEQRFSTAILPLFVPAGRHRTSVARRDARVQSVAYETGLSLWQIEILNPDSRVFSDFSDPALSRKLGRPALRNDYLAEQHQAHLRQGWLEGHGPGSGLTVFQANSLRLRLNLLYKPRTPGIAFILKKLGTGRLDRVGVAWQKGYLVAERVVEVMMQSHAQHWRATDQNMRPLSKKDIVPFAAVPIKEYLSSAGASSVHAVNNVSGQRATMLPGRVVAADRAILGVAVNDAATDKNAAAVNDVATQKDAVTEENKLCDGLLCCQ
jgi:hypothetical protein